MERQLPNSFVDRYVSTLTHSTSIFTRHIFPSSRMYTCTVARTDVGSAVPRCGKTHGSYANTRARVRGVCIESILVACTIRLHRCSNGWTTRTSEWPNRCGTIRTEPPLTLSVGSTPNNFRLTVTRFTGLQVTSAERQRGIQRARTHASDMSRHGRRHQQVGEHHDGYPAIDE